MSQNSKIRTNLGHPGCLLFFALFWTGFSAVFFWLSFDSDELFPIIMMGFFILIGLGLTAYALLGLFTRYLVGKPEINVSNTTLAVGESFEVNFLHSVQRNIIINKISVQLILQEKATYRQGTNTRTVTHSEIVQEYEEIGQEYSGGDFIQGNYQFQIPRHAMHTLKVRRNEITWRVMFHLDVPRLPDFTKEVELTVVPKLAVDEGFDVKSNY